MTASPAISNTVSLILMDGTYLCHFKTGRTEFPPFATWERDRLFLLASDAGGAAVYVEVQPWHISALTTDPPKPRERQGKSAVVLPFKRKEPVDGGR